MTRAQCCHSMLISSLLSLSTSLLSWLSRATCNLSTSLPTLQWITDKPSMVSKLKSQSS